MTDDPIEARISTPSIARLIAQFLQAMLELFQPAVPSGATLAARVRSEHEEEQAADAAILRRYAGAIHDTDDLTRRAAAHGVVFATALRAEYRAAILDFLDNPNAPTRLTATHTTWFWGAGPDGQPTGSRTHAVNRAVYRWHAHDLARMQPYGDAHHDRALEQLRTVHYPLDRLAWTAAQWAAHEERGAPARPNPARIAPGTRQATSEGVPRVL